MTDSRLLSANQADGLFSYTLPPSFGGVSVSVLDMSSGCEKLLDLDKYSHSDLKVVKFKVRGYYG